SRRILMTTSVAPLPPVPSRLDAVAGNARRTRTDARRAGGLRSRSRRDPHADDRPVAVTAVRAAANGAHPVDAAGATGAASERHAGHQADTARVLPRRDPPAGLA